MTKPSRSHILFLMAALIWSETYGRTNDNFPAYISTLGKPFSLSQTQLHYLAFSENLGKLFAPVAGLVLRHLPLETVLIINSVLGFLSYFIQLLYDSKFRPAVPPFWLIYICNAIAGHSARWYNTVCHTIIFTRFRPSSWDKAVGFLICFRGLSAEIYADMVAAFMPGLSPDLAYLFLNATIPCIIVFMAILPMVAIVRDKDDIDLEGSVFWPLLSLTMAVRLGAVLGYIILFRILLIPTLLLPVLLYIRSRHVGTHAETMEQPSADVLRIQINSEVNNDGAENREEHCSQQTAEVSDAGTSDINDTEVQGASIGSAPIEDTLPLRYLLLYFAVHLCATAGTTFLNYLAMISESRNYIKTDQLFLINLAALANFIGRLLPSALFRFRFFNRVSRPWSMSLILVMMGIAIFLSGIDNLLVLQVSVAVTSACKGAFTTISVSATRVHFGINNFAVNHDIVILIIPCGSFLFGRMVSLLFEQHSTKGKKCTGRDCFDTSFFILGAICLFGAALAYGFHHCSVRRN